VLLQRSRTPFQADVWRIDRPTGPVVRKSFERQSWLLRRTIGTWIVWREVRNLQDLEGIPGIPRLVARPAPWTLEMTFMQAESLPTYESRSLVTAGYFDSLDKIVAQMHARGISHGDLRRPNLLWHPDTLQPVVLDFAQSLSRRDWLMRPFLSLAFRIDQAKLLRLRAWFLGKENLTEQQREDLEHKTPRTMKIGRQLRRRLYRPLKRLYQGRPLTKQHGPLAPGQPK